MLCHLMQVWESKVRSVVCLLAEFVLAEAAKVLEAAAAVIYVTILDMPNIRIT